jgi:hypothetical protein
VQHFLFVYNIIITVRQVSLTYTADHPTPEKRSGRRPCYGHSLGRSGNTRCAAYPIAQPVFRGLAASPSRASRAYRAWTVWTPWTEDFIVLYSHAPWTALMALHGQLMNTLSTVKSTVHTTTASLLPPGTCTPQVQSQAGHR